MTITAQVKVKATLEKAARAHTGSRGMATLFIKPRRWTGDGGQHHAPAVLSPAMARYPLYRRLGGPESRSGQVRKISPPLPPDSIPGPSIP